MDVKGWLGNVVGLKGKRLDAAVECCESNLVESIDEIRTYNLRGDLNELFPALAIRSEVKQVLKQEIKSLQTPEIVQGPLNSNGDPLQQVGRRDTLNKSAGGDRKPRVAQQDEDFWPMLLRYGMTFILFVILDSVVGQWIRRQLQGTGTASNDRQEDIERLLRSQEL